VAIASLVYTMSFVETEALGTQAVGCFVDLLVSVPEIFVLA
jgi:hypothetical protein